MLLTDDQASRISADGLIHDAQRLKELQNLPLHRKVSITIARITEWYGLIGIQRRFGFQAKKD